MRFGRKSHGRKGMLAAAAAGIGALLGGAAFWRRRRKREQEAEERPSPAPQAESTEKDAPPPGESQEQ
jgi:LPXTG-motif cell wall-anchored protein